MNSQNEARIETRKMSASARSVFVFGAYMIPLGIGLIAVPNFLLAMFSLPSTREVWIRTLGMLLLWMGYVFVQAARKEMTEFFRLTVHFRILVIFLLTAFVLLGYATAPLILFGVADFLGASWTAWTLRRRQQSDSPIEGLIEEGEAFRRLSEVRR